MRMPIQTREKASGVRVLCMENENVLSAKIAKIPKRILIIGSSVAALTVVILVIRFFIEKFAVEKKEWSGYYALNFVQFFTAGVTVFVASSPAGLPVAVALSSASSVKFNNLVRDWHTCEMLGKVTSITVNKTTSLTTNRRRVVQSYVGGEHFIHSPR
ncbi:hypothetical protein HAZT_HAZT011555 [Hyalella azteca]|uniref:Uncharacterized protein n=1 Tax=Hyalella azteca TaxID=294128 RepID=A0A6A0H1M7_HYAAZ|nr:hypothetical protein HAZT_HAZT011555 [Hyalella azteca]